MNKKIFIGLIFGLIWFDSYAENDPFLEDFNPSSLNQPGKEYPMVYTQGYAMFRIEAPDAKSVKVGLGLGGKRGNVLKHQADSTWRGTSAGPLDEGLHYYYLTVDGGTFNDPGALNFYGSTRWESGIEIPAHYREFDALKDVQTFSLTFYEHSKDHRP